MRIAVVVAFFAAIFVAGCRFDLPAAGDGGLKRCTGSSPGCICVNMVCVECTAADERSCSGTRPQCGDDNVCRACRSNDECDDSGACLEDGSCAPKSQVIYAAPNGAGDCSQTSACSLTQALALVDPSRNIIRLAPGTYTVPATVDGLDFGAKSATLVARGATLTRAAPNGAILSVRNGQTLKIVGGTLQGPSNTTDGIKCDGSKLLVHEVTIDGMSQSGIETNVCQLTVSRSTLLNNDLGGINMTNTASVATITNNFVYRNGGPASPIGGMSLKLASGSKLELNTVVDNTADASMSTLAGGIVCEGQGYNAPFNLVYRNFGGTGGQVQVVGTCTFQGSYQQGASPGENAVGFENPAGATPSYRLTPASPPAIIRDAFDCRDIDFERDARPFPAGGKCDFGADEYRDRP